MEYHSYSVFVVYSDRESGWMIVEGPVARGLHQDLGSDQFGLLLYSCGSFHQYIYPKPITLDYLLLLTHTSHTCAFSLLCDYLYSFLPIQNTAFPVSVYSHYIPTIHSSRPISNTAFFHKTLSNLQTNMNSSPLTSLVLSDLTLFSVCLVF